ncbi:MAG: hypothetical protein ACJAZV_001830 [Roseivirga sp.]|jgi:hypothetical protein
MSEITLTTISVNQEFISVFDQEVFPQHLSGGMILTERINALNFRIRESKAGYTSDWHVAGDPTLIIIQKGTLRIKLRNGEYQDFGTGTMFIAKDFLPKNIDFDTNKHGHKAEVMGEESLLAVHIKLNEISN